MDKINESSGTVFTRRTVFFQLVAGVLAGFLNYVFSSSMLKLGIPLFMDTIFTAAASCFGLLCGILAAISSHIVSFVIAGFSFPEDASNMVFVFCSLTVVLGMRILIHLSEKREFSVSPLHLFALGIMMALVISIEGAFFYVLLLKYSEYVIDNKAVSTLIYTLITQKVSLIASSTLARIPVNMVDKLIAVFAGWYLAKLVNKLANMVTLCKNKEETWQRK